MGDSVFTLWAISLAFITLQIAMPLLRLNPLLPLGFLQIQNSPQLSVYTLRLKHMPMVLGTETHLDKVYTQAAGKGFSVLSFPKEQRGLWYPGRHYIAGW